MFDKYARAHAVAAQPIYAMTGSQSVVFGIIIQSCRALLKVKPVTWLELWQHIAQDCESALVLRLALDDQNPGVIAAAALALQALTGSRHWGSGLYVLDAGRRPAGVMAERTSA